MEAHTEKNESKGQEKWTERFLLSASVLLLGTGMAKIISAFGSNAILSKPDPIFEIRYQKLFWIAGGLELAVSGILVCFDKKPAQIVTLLVITLNFLAYRVALWSINWKGYCPCLGQLTEALHISPALADKIAIAILAYFLMGTSFLGFRLYEINSKEQC